MIKKLNATIYSKDNLKRFSKHSSDFSYWSNTEATYRNSYLHLKIYSSRIDIKVDIEQWLKTLYIGDLSYHRRQNQRNYIFFCQFESMFNDIEETFKMNQFDTTFVRVDIRNSIIKSFELNFEVSLDDLNFIKFFAPDLEEHLGVTTNRNLVINSHDFFISAGELDGAIKSTLSKDTICYSFSEYNTFNHRELITFNKVYDNKVIQNNKLQILFSIECLYDYTIAKLLNSYSTSNIYNFLHHGKINTKAQGLFCDVLLEKTFWNILISDLEFKLMNIKFNSTSIVLENNLPNAIKDITDFLIAISTDDDYWDNLVSNGKLNKRSAKDNQKKFKQLSKNINTLYSKRKEDLNITHIQLTSYATDSFFNFFE